MRKKRVQKKYMYRRLFFVIFVVLLFMVPIHLLAKKRATPKPVESSFCVETLRRNLKEAYVQAKAKQPAEVAANEEITGERVVYLTFDDGPNNKITPQVLDILDREQVKATFFVVGNKVDQYPEVLEDIYKRGHAIGNHTYSHDYAKIYASTEAFMADFKKNEEAMKRALGEGFSTVLVRFPGGSFEGYKQPIGVRLNELGYHFYDWNAINGDGESDQYTVEYMVDKFKTTAEGKDTLIVLLHDSEPKQKTVDSLPEMISWLKAKGYTFRTLLEVGQ